MNPEDRIATLKEIVRLGEGTIDERRRAQALLRSLSQGRDLHDQRGTKVRSLPAVGRDVVTSDLGYRTGNKRPKKDISFFNQPQFGKQDDLTADRPFKGGLKDSKSKALRYQLGEAFDKDVPKNSSVKITPTDNQRAKAYQRMTGGAMEFQEKPLFPGARRAIVREGQSYKNKKGNFQPMTDGKFGKAKPNPAERLRKPLIDAATSDKPIIRKAGHFAKILRVPGAVPFNTIMLGADIGQAMEENLPVNTSVSGRGGGRRALND